jgi:hypothetical protein
MIRTAQSLISLWINRRRQQIVLARAVYGFSGYGHPVLRVEPANRLLSARLKESKPLMVTRLGNSELDAMSFWHFHRGNSREHYPMRVAKRMGLCAGLFPVTDDSLDRFSQLYSEAVRKTDIMGVWFNKHEDYFCRNYCGQAELVELRGIEPYFSRCPWSAHLAGRKVLVIHPFAQTIERQYKSVRKHLFKNPKVLPPFELKTVRAVLSLANHTSGFSDWFEALAHMQQEISEVDFDIALIGAGAYGLPLAAYIKGLGKQAVHMGGATQLMFGIKGKRWDGVKDVARFYNEYWVRPLPEETPAEAGVVEGGCYW